MKSTWAVAAMAAAGCSGGSAVSSGLPPGGGSGVGGAIVSGGGAGGVAGGRAGGTSGTGNTGANAGAGNPGGTSAAAGTNGIGGGTGGAGGGAVAGAGGGGACIDVVVGAKWIQQDDKLVADANLVVGGAWVDAGVAGVGWIDGRLNTKRLVPVATSVGSDGAAVAPAIMDFLPDGVTIGVSGIASRPGGYAVVYVATEQIFKAFLALTNMSGEVTSQIYLGPAGGAGEPAPTGVAWDGEAFAVHGFDPLPSGSVALYVARVATNGTILLPWKQYGVTQSLGNASLGDHRSQTDAVSGVTFTFDANGAAVLNGHVRNGSPIPGLPRALTNDNGKAFTTTYDPAVDVSSSGAWLAFKQNGPAINLSAYTRRVALDGSDIGNIVAPYPPDGQGPYTYLSVLARPDGSGWLGVSTGTNIFGFELSSNGAGPAVAFVSAPAFTFSLAIDYPMAREASGRLWYYYGTGKGKARLVAVDGACVYPPEPPG